MPRHEAPSRPTTPEASSNKADPTTPKARRRDDPTTPKAPARRAQNLSDRPLPIRPSSEATHSKATEVQHPLSDDDDAEDTRVTPPPFCRYVEHECPTLGHLIQTQLPPAPVFSSDDPKFLSTTKALSLTEQDLHKDETLTMIIYAPRMLRPLMAVAEELLSRLHIDFKLHIDFIVAISPWNTSVGLPDVVFSEKDIENWIIRVLLVPALNIVRAFRAKAIPTLQRGVGGPAKLSAFERGPYVSSAPASTHSIPDGVVVDVGKSIKATVEVKCHNVLKNAQSSYFLDSVDAESIFYPLLNVHRDKNGRPKPGRAIKFNWPPELRETEDKDERPSAADSQTRILVQIFTQLFQNHCDLGMLSSYIFSLFYYRDGRTLYMSRSYWDTEEIFLATIAWVAMVLEVPGFEKTKMNLPRLDTSFWTEYMEHEITAPGVVLPTLPNYQLQSRRRNRKT